MSGGLERTFRDEFQEDEGIIFQRIEDFEIGIPEDTEKCLVFGLKAGVWQDERGNEYTVSEKEAMAEIVVSGQSKLQLRFVKSFGGVYV